MSIFEILVILIVGFLVAKPEDFPKIFKKIKEMRSFVNNTKKELMSHFDPMLQIGEESLLENYDNLEEEKEQINFYLSKITNLGEQYDGEYSLDSIKNYYNLISKDKEVKTLDINETAK